MSATVNNLLIDKAIIIGKKVSASKAGTKKKIAPETKPIETPAVENQNQTA